MTIRRVSVSITEMVAEAVLDTYARRLSAVNTTPAG